MPDVPPSSSPKSAEVDSAAAQASAAGQAIIWTSARRDLQALLHAVHPDVARLYAHAIEALSSVPLTRPDLMVGSHCLRELVPCLLEAQHLTIPTRAPDTRAAKMLSQAWVAYELRLDPDDDANYVSADLRPVPHAVYVAARAAAAAGVEGTQNSRRVTSLVALGQDAEIDSAPIARLHIAIEKFRAWNHRVDYTKPLRDVPPIEEVVAPLVILEEALRTRFANRGDRVDALRATLRAANQRSGGADV